MKSNRFNSPIPMGEANDKSQFRKIIIEKLIIQYGFAEMETAIEIGGLIAKALSEDEGCVCTDPNTGCDIYLETV